MSSIVSYLTSSMIGCSCSPAYTILVLVFIHKNVKQVSLRVGSTLRLYSWSQQSYYIDDTFPPTSLGVQHLLAHALHVFKQPCMDK
jgi:hypothetical protein